MRIEHLPVYVVDLHNFHLDDVRQRSPTEVHTQLALAFCPELNSFYIRGDPEHLAGGDRFLFESTRLIHRGSPFQSSASGLHRRAGLARAASVPGGLGGWQRAGERAHE